MLSGAGAAGCIRGRRSSRAGCRQRIALARRFRLGLAVEGRSGRLYQGSAIQPRRVPPAHRPGQAVQAWAGCREQERQAVSGVGDPAAPGAASASPWPGGSGLGWLSGAGAAGLSGVGDPAAPGAAGASPWPGGSGLGWLSRAGAAGLSGVGDPAAPGAARRIALGRRFRLGLAVEGRSGRLIRGRRSSRAGCRPSASPWAGGSGLGWLSGAGAAGLSGVGDPAAPGAAGASPWAGGSGLGWLSRAGAAGLSGVGDPAAPGAASASPWAGGSGLGWLSRSRSGRLIRGRRSSRAGCRRQRLRGRLGAGTLLDRHVNCRSRGRKGLANGRPA